MTPNKKIQIINKIFNKYYGILRLIPKGGKIDKRMAQKLNISEDMVSILNRAIFYGEMRANNKRISIKDIEKAFNDTQKRLSPKLNLLVEESAQNFENTLTKNNTEVYRRVVEELKKEFKVLDTVFEDEKVPRREMANILRQITKDNKQDFEMVVRTELQNNKEEGFIDAILKGKSIYSKDKEKTRIYRRPNPDACKHCKKLYTTDGVTPRIFTVEEILKNGSNVGRKASEWQPVMGATHPHCQCVWQVMPDGYTFDKGSLVKGD